jgi:hypothetical protein
MGFMISNIFAYSIQTILQIIETIAKVPKKNETLHDFNFLFIHIPAILIELSIIIKINTSHTSLKFRIL